MNNQGLATTQSVDVSVYGDFTASELDTIRRTLAKDCDDAQFALFMKVASSAGLNPFLGHIHPIVYKGSLSIQIAYEGYQHKAQAHSEYLGIDAQTIHENDEFEADMTEVEGQQFIKITKHKIGFPRGKMLGGYAIARRKGRPDFVVLMEVSEVDHLMKNRDMWKNYPIDMFKKHMKKRACKGQFDIAFDEDEPMAPNLIDVTPPYEPQASAQRVNAPRNAKVIQTGENEFTDQEAILEQKRDEIRSKMNQCGMNTDVLDEFAMNKLGYLPREMNAKQLIALSKLLDFEIQQVAQALTHQASLLDDLPEELR